MASPRRTWGSDRGELVAVAVKGQDEDGAIGVGFELPAELQDVRVDSPRRGKPLVSPHFVEQPLARDHLAAMGDQVNEQVELLARETHFLAGSPDLARPRADAH